MKCFYNEMYKFVNPLHMNFFDSENNASSFISFIVEEKNLFQQVHHALGERVHRFSAGLG